MTMNSKNTKSVITKKDFWSVFFRSLTLDASWNYERMQNLAYAYAMAPIIRRLYKNNEEKKAALERHLEFMSVTPHISTLCCIKQSPPPVILYFQYLLAGGFYPFGGGQNILSWDGFRWIFSPHQMRCRQLQHAGQGGQIEHIGHAELGPDDAHDGGEPHHRPPGAGRPAPAPAAGLCQAH